MTTEKEGRAIVEDARVVRNKHVNLNVGGRALELPEGASSKTVKIGTLVIDSGRHRDHVGSNSPVRVRYLTGSTNVGNAEGVKEDTS